MFIPSIVRVVSTYFLSAVPDLEEGLPVGASHFV